jgi:hypothetical protein
MKEGTPMLNRINNVLGRIEIAEDKSSWDFGFLESIRDQLAQGRTLSTKQQDILQQIEGRWSDEALRARGEWHSSWDDEKEERFSIALQYYYKTGYYSSLTTKYLGADHTRRGVPTEKEYNKLVLNKYAQGIIRNVTGETKFPAGTTAQLRQAGSQASAPVVILKNCEDATRVTSFAKGAKPIQVLLIGSATPFWTEERYLKKAKKRK